MKRCPYCKKELPADASAHCPHCGKVMLTPKMLETPIRLAKKRTIEKIWRDNEEKKASLHGLFSPGMFHNPKIYFIMIFALVVMGLLVFKATDQAVERKFKRRESPVERTQRHLNTLATALGRYRFHVGSYPSLRIGGLRALVRDPGKAKAPKWLGPYINVLPPDPWLSPFEYAPPSDTHSLPTLFSRGPDKLAHTADDIYPDPQAFNCGTAWTNGWLRAEDRYLPGVNISGLLPEPPKK